MTELKKTDVSIVSVRDAAEVLGTTVPRVLMLMRSGALEGKCIDGVWQVSGESLDRCPLDTQPHVRSGCGACHGCGS
jgi:hypothetical protein